MYKLLYKFFLLFLIIAFWGCTKETSFNGSSELNLFTENLAPLKKGEPILLSFNSGGTITPKWTITPNTNVFINAIGNNASIEFKAAGKYTIIASAAGKQGTYNATVTDSVFAISGSRFALIANKIVDIAPLQIVEFFIQNAASNNVTWSIGANVNNINIAPNNLSAQISFTSPFSGTSSSTSTVGASDGINSQNRTIWINSVPSSTQTMVPFLYTDKLLITPSITTDTAGRKTLVLKAKTQFNYQCSSDIILSQSGNNLNGYALNYGGVNMSKTVCATQGPANATNSFFNMPVGNHVFTIGFGNKTLTGSINVASNGVFTFNWNNNSEVIISPLTIQ